MQMGECPSANDGTGGFCGGYFLPSQYILYFIRADKFLFSYSQSSNARRTGLPGLPGSNPRLSTLPSVLLFRDVLPLRRHPLKTKKDGVQQTESKRMHVDSIRIRLGRDVWRCPAGAEGESSSWHMKHRTRTKRVLESSPDERKVTD